MSGVSVKKVTVLNNPAAFTDPYRFEVTYQALQDLDDDLEWTVSYLSSPQDASLDQELESVMVGPISAGVYKFILEADAPDGSKIPVDDLIGNSGVVLSCSFNESEFIRVGFYVYVDYNDESLKDNPPEIPQFDKLIRNVANDDPRITTKPLDPKPKEIPETDEGTQVETCVKNEEGENKGASDDKEVEGVEAIV